ncbi:MAG: hypothetical protein RR577_02485 [Erysipelotrichales bacterium]
MKKKMIFSLVFVFAFLLGVTNVSAAPKGENLTLNNVKVEYNAKTKELYAYGYNKYGNLGSGNTSTVSKENKVNINEKIGNKKIIDYIFNIHSTYVLSEDGKVYASGLEIGNGSKQVNKFTKLNLYGQSKIKVAYLSSSFFGFEEDPDGEKNVDKEDINDCKKYSIACTTEVLMGIKGNKSGYVYHNLYKHMNDSSSDIMLSDSNAFINNRISDEITKALITSKYPVYVKENPKSVSMTNVNSKTQITKNIRINKKFTYLEKRVYTQGKLTYFSSYSNGKRVIKNYKNNKITNQRVTTYINGKSVKKRRIKVDTTYKYKNGLSIQATTKKRTNNKLRLFSKTDYKRNKKGELKSNKNGKAYKNVRYYKGGKVKSKYQYTYNSKGKIVKKKAIK